jgi:hypothetical protein
MVGVVGDKISFAIQTGPAFKEFALRDAAGTSGRVPFQTTSGRLTDDANLLYSTNLLTLTGAFKIIEDANGSFARSTNSTALTTLGTGSTTTATASNLAAANSKIKAILLRVTTTITTAVQFTIGVTGGNVFCQIGTATTLNTAMTSGSTYVMVPCAHADAYVSAATTLTYTLDANPGAGAIRATVVYEDFQAPTS